MQLEDVKNQIQAELDAKGLNMGYNPDLPFNGYGLSFITAHMSPEAWIVVKEIVATTAAVTAAQGHWYWKLKPTFWGNGQPIDGGFAFATIPAHQVQAVAIKQIRGPRSRL